MQERDIHNVFHEMRLVHSLGRLHEADSSVDLMIGVTFIYANTDDVINY